MTFGSLREFTIRDYDAVRALWERSDGVGLSPADAIDGVERFLRRNQGTSFVAVVEGAVAGAVMVGNDGRRGLIHHLVVAPEHRRRGLGRELVRAGLAALRVQGIDKAHLLVFADNAPARAFWANLGATPRDDLALYSISVP